DDLPRLKQLIGSGKKVQLVFIDDHGLTYAKANGTVNRMREDIGIQTDFIYLTAPPESAPPKENEEYIHTLNQDEEFYVSMLLLSRRLSEYVGQRMSSLQPPEIPINRGEKKKTILGRFVS